MFRIPIWRPLVAMLAAAGACSAREESGRDGTQRMADTLASLYQQAAVRPEGYQFLNRERVAAMRAAGQTRGRGGLQERFAFARERLLAGETREAIADLEAVRASAGLIIHPGAPQDQPFFDLLGVAYMRLAEQENCLLHPGTSVCILGELRHEQQDGARKAIGVYEALLTAFPDDDGSRWLLNIAYMAVGEYPAKVPKPFLIPDLTTRRTAFPRFTDIARNVGAAVTGLAGGLCVADYNNDGLLDLFTTAWGLADPVHVLIADGRGGYEDRTARAHVAGITGGPNCAHADYDNDGDEDVFIMRGGWLADGGRFPNSLLRNRGDATFDDVTFAAGVGSMHPTHTAGWADFNLDGWLDLFVGHESGTGMGWSSHPSELFLSNRDGTFTEVSARVGMALDAFVKGATWGDVNNDGLPDLYVSIFGGPNRLYLNRGGTSIDAWRFAEVSASAGTRSPIMSFPTWFWDYDNDGREDLLVFAFDNTTPLHAAIAREYLGRPPSEGTPGAVESARLYRNRGDGTFEDATAAARLSGKAIFAMGSNFGDIDNDGWLDFYAGTGNPDLRSIIPNRMFRGVDGRRFEEVTVEGGFGHLQKGHGTAFADLDRDGDEDVYMVLGGAYTADVFASSLFENPGWPGRQWIALDLQGRTANRSAIGARVEVVTADAAGRRRTLWRTIGRGGSYGVGALQLHVGLGPASRITSVRVTWPDSLRDTSNYSGLEPGHFYLLIQGDTARRLDRPAVPFRRPADSPSVRH